MAEGVVARDEDYHNESEEDTELQKAKQALTGRGVTLSDLMDDGIIQAGENILSIDYRVCVYSFLTKLISRSYSVCVSQLFEIEWYVC